MLLFKTAPVRGWSIFHRTNITFPSGTVTGTQIRITIFIFILRTAGTTGTSTTRAYIMRRRRRLR